MQIEPQYSSVAYLNTTRNTPSSIEKTDSLGFMNISKKWFQFSIKIKQFRQESFLFLFVITTTRMRRMWVIRMCFLMLRVMCLWIWCLLYRLLRLNVIGIKDRHRYLRHRIARIGGRRNSIGTLDQFIQLSSIQPDTTTLWAIINFYTLTVRHQKMRIFTNWTFHHHSRRSIYRM